MITLSESVATDWCARNGLQLRVGRNVSVAFAPPLETQTFMICLDADIEAASDTVFSFARTPTGKTSSRAFIWLDSCGGFYNAIERLAWDRLLAGYHIDVPPHRDRIRMGMVFEEAEFQDAIMLLSVIFIVGWRATFVDLEGRFSISTCDKEWIWFRAASDLTASGFSELLAVYEAKAVNVD